jgi:hypothetical protein
MIIDGVFHVTIKNKKKHMTGGLYFIKLTKIN